MAFFAVIQEPSDNSFVVTDCHINLWSLSGLLGRRFYWDTGLRLTAGANPVTKFQIALPFGTDPDAMSDLHDVLLNLQAAELLFSRPVKIGDGPTLDYGDGPVVVGSVPPTDAARDAARSGKDYSLWTLRLSTPLSPGAQTYIRFRFAVSDTGRIWNWKCWAFSRFGAVVDARITDYRESWNVKDGASLKNRMMPIDNLNLFVIAPVKYQPRVTSPSLHYLRILEGRAWEPYLGRATSFFRREKLAIYQWRSSKVTQLKPFRAYLDISKEFGILSFLNVTLCAIAVVGLVLVGNYTSLYLQELALGALAFARTLIRSHPISFTLTAILTFLFGLSNRIAIMRAVVVRIRLHYRALEDAIYEARS